MSKILVFQTPPAKPDTEPETQDEKLIMYNDLANLLRKTIPE